MMRNLRGTTNCGLRLLYELPVHLQRLPSTLTDHISYGLALGVSLDHIWDDLELSKSGSKICQTTVHP